MKSGVFGLKMHTRREAVLDVLFYFFGGGRMQDVLLVILMRGLPLSPLIGVFPRNSPVTISLEINQCGHMRCPPRFNTVKK